MYLIAAFFYQWIRGICYLYFFGFASFFAARAATTIRDGSNRCCPAV
jgi:hypothetical protein